MTRKVIEHEMDRRRAMVRAECSLINAMEGHGLTSMEWVSVLNEMMQRMIKRGLIEDWKDK